MDMLSTKDSYIDSLFAEKIGEKNSPVSIKGAESITDFVDKIIKAVTGANLAQYNDRQAPKSNTDYQNPETDYGSQTASVKKRKEINKKCKEIIARVGDEPGKLTPEEINILRQYSGKGGLKEGTIHEYYTPAFVAEGMYDALGEMGLTSGNILDPSTGSGSFSEAKPKSMIVTGAEIDETSSQVNQLLHPEDKIHHMCFEDFNNETPDNTFDGCCTNIPWGRDEKGARGEWKNKDKAYSNENSIERYFIYRIIDKVRHGGLICLAVPPRIVERKDPKWVKFRIEVSKKAEFLGAHKLPSGMSKKQGTDTVWDIVVFKKHPKQYYDMLHEIPEEKLWEHNVIWDTFVEGKWFKAEGKKFIHGKFIPANPKDYRPADRVQLDYSNPQLKRKLAQRFKSRIDWAGLQMEEPIVHNYAEGDTKYINQVQHQFTDGEWVKVEQTDSEQILLDQDKYGANNENELFGKCGTIRGALSLSFAQASNAFDRYKEAGLISGIQKKAIEKAKAVKAEFAEQVYRYNIIGKMCQDLMDKAVKGKDDEIERETLKTVIAAEIDKYGHPYNNKKLMLAGSDSHEFNMFCSMYNEKGEENDLLKGEITSVSDKMQYDPTNIAAIVEHLALREGNQMVTLDDIKLLYTGNHNLDSIADLAHIENIGITPQGIILPVHKYCSGDINLKIGKLTEAIANESNQKLKEKFQFQIDLMESKRKLTALEDITFSARQNWMDKDIVREFLKVQGIKAKFGRKVIKIRNEGTSYESQYEDFETGDFKDGNWFLDSSGEHDQSHTKEYFRFLNGQKVREIAISKEVRESTSPEQLAKMKGDSLKQRFEFINKLEDEFQAFVESHSKADEIHRTYNVKFNSFVDYEHPGDDLGLDLPDWLVPHGYQNSEVRRLSELGAGICGFNVGLGKTTTALVLHKYNLKMGRTSKTCIVVPNSVTANWYHEAKAVYGNLNNALFVGVSPTFDKKGNIIQEKIKDDEGNYKSRVDEKTGETVFQYGDKLKEDSPQEIKKKLFSIPTTKKDLVVIPKSRFEMIPMKAESKKTYMDEQVSRHSIGSADATKFVFTGGKDLLQKTKDEAGQKGKAISYDDAMNSERLKELYSRESQASKDEYPFFEDMGFTNIMSDESHEYKNSFTGSAGMADYEYLPKIKTADTALSMAAKCNYLRKANNGQGTFCLSATPVTNSPLEIWNALSLVCDNSMFDQYDIHTPDDFLKQFCKFDTVDKVRLSGKEVTVQGMVGFSNLGALRSIFNRFASIKDANDVNLPLPENDSKTAIVELTEDQKGIYGMLQSQAEEAAKKRQSGKIMSIMRKMEAVTTDIDLYLQQITFHFNPEDQGKVKKLIDDLPEKLEYVKKQPIAIGEENGKVIYQTKTDPKTGKVTLEYELKTLYLNRSDITADLQDGVLVVVAPATPASIGVTYEKPIMERFNKFDIVENRVTHPVPPKYAKIVEDIRNGYQIDVDGKVKNINGKHIIFTEEKTQHNKLARILTHNVPIDRNKIVIINGETGKKKADLAKFTEGYNSGKYTIAICNRKAEVGLNLQKGTTQIHMLDFRWTPASLTQRDGRGIRQGNYAEHVRSSKYVAKDSADAFKLQILENKDGWINALLKGDTEEIDSDQSDKESMMEEMMAALSGNAEQYYEEQRKKKEAKLKAKKDRKTRGYVNTLTQIQNLQLFITGGFQEEKKIENAQLEAKRAASEEKLQEASEKIELKQQKLVDMLEVLKESGSKIKKFKKLPFEEFSKIQKIKSADRTLKQKSLFSATKILNQIDDLDWSTDFYQKDVANATKRIDTIDARYEKKIKEKEELLRIKKGALKKAKDLPFDISVLDDPNSAIITQNGFSWQKGKLYQFEKNEQTVILKVEEVQQKKAKIEILVGRNTGETTWLTALELNKIKGVAPCTLSEDEINLKRIIAEGVEYGVLAKKLSKEAFHENLAELKVKGDFFVIREDGTIDSIYDTSGRNAKKENIVYPDSTDEALKSKVFKEYLRRMREGVGRSDYMDAMRNVYGNVDVGRMAAEYGEKMPVSEIREAVAKRYAEIYKDQIEDDYYDSKLSSLTELQSRLRQGLENLLVDQIIDKADNTEEMKDIAIQYKQAKLVEVNAEVDELEEAEEAKRRALERAETDKLKNHPDFKEVPEKMEKAFAEIGIKVVCNHSAINNYGSFEPFSRWCLYDKKAMPNTLFKKKGILKSQYSAKFLKGKINGMGDDSRAWWHIPSSIDLDDLFNELELQQIAA